jgi:hypothetical protein
MPAPLLAAAAGGGRALLGSTGRAGASKTSQAMDIIGAMPSPGGGAHGGISKGQFQPTNFTQDLQGWPEYNMNIRPDDGGA